MPDIDDERRPAADEPEDLADASTIAWSAGSEDGRRAGGAPWPTLPGYEILGLLGVGGMGMVFEAWQQSPRRKVALKVLRSGSVADDLGVRLFRREAQTLARLKHPHIAAIYESGLTDDDRHFFAMELVSGETLERHLTRSDRGGRMSAAQLRERLRIFCTIGDAVAYAHQRGVIHRDLKPSNLIVTREEPSSRGGGDAGLAIKVLDFGLAKLTDADIALTTVPEVGAVWGTLPYMSPEQARGNPDEIDARSDVYALGVLLYWMLTGALPYAVRKGSLLEAVRVINEEPPRPLREAWRGTGRPDSDLETIVRKALEKRPDDRYASATALADDVHRYMTNQAILARPPSAIYQLRKLVARNKLAAAFAAAGLLLLLIFSIWMSALYGRATHAEVRSRQEAQTAMEVSDFLEGLFAVSDPSEARGNSVTAREILDEGAASIERDLAAAPAVRARLEGTIGRVYTSIGLYREAEPLLRAAHRTQQGLVEPQHPAAISTTIDLARLLLQAGHYGEADSLFRAALTFGSPIQSDILRADILSDLATIRYQTGDIPGADSLYTQVLELRQHALGPDHPDVSETLGDLAVMHIERGDQDGAIELFREALAIVRRSLPPDHPELASAVDNLAVALKRSGNYEEAEQLYREAIEIRRKIHGEEHPDLARSLNNLGRLLQAKGDKAGAESMLRQALAMRRSLFGDEHLEVSEALHNLGILCFQTDRPAEAANLYREALAIRSAINPDSPRTASTAMLLGDALIALGRPGEAEPILRESLAVRKKGPTVEAWLIDYTECLLGHAIALQGRHEEAERWLLAGYEAVLESAPRSDKRTVLGHLIALYEDWGRKKEAARFRSMLDELAERTH